MSRREHARGTMELIQTLTEIPSPTGNTQEIIRFIEDHVKKDGFDPISTRKGGLLISVEGQDTSQHRFLTGHVDTLGAMVKEIKSDGRLKLSMIGGFRWNSVEGEYCTIQTSSDKKYTGTILIHQTSVHVYKEAGEAKRDEQNIEVRLDEKVHSPEDVRELGIEVGDFVSFDARAVITDSDYIKSRHLDDKASVGMLLRLLSRIKSEKLTLPYTTHFYISNNEEIGYGGNSNISPQTVEYLAVDMGALGDGQASDEYTVSICAKDSSGPYHYGLRKHLVDLAKTNNIDYKVDIYPYYGSDASAAVKAGHDIIHGLVGAGIDASHAFERTHISSIENTEELLYHYVQSPMVGY